MSVQNVPDIWGLLKRALPWMATQYGTREEFAKLDPIRDQMKAALAQRADWQLVPKEPNQAMANAGYQEYLDWSMHSDGDSANRSGYCRIYRAMLDAAPKPSEKP